jgi:predicted anti-sigma-YlaC factor YlaD
MKPHYSEADLLETYYTRPGESMPVMMHLADCPDCAARYERLESKMQGLRSCHRDEKPETFWVRQRMSIMRRIGAQQRRTSRVPRIAAAAAIVLAIGGGVFTWQRSEAPEIIEVPTQTAVFVEEPTVVQDESPWQSEELQDYSSIVAWESWVDHPRGDQS